MRNLDASFVCPVHPLPMLVTQSKLQRVCQVLGCDEHVRLSGPLMPDKEKEPMVKQENNDQTRKKQIEEVAAKKKAEAAATKKPVDPPTKKAKKDAPQKAADAELDKTVAGKKPEDADMLSVSDVARELGLDPKRARAKLRALGQSATEGRWPKVKRGSKKHQELVDLLTPEEESEDVEEETDDDGDDE